MRIGEILVKHDLIKNSHIDLIHGIQEKNGKKFGQILLDEGIITHDELIFSMVQQHLLRESSKKNVFKFRQVRTFLTHCSKNLNSSLAISFLFFITGILIIMYAKAIGYFISNIAISGSMSTIGYFLALIFGLFLSRKFIEFFRDLFNVRFSQILSFELRNSLYRHLMLIPLRNSKKYSTGELINRLLDNVTFVEALSINFFQGFIGSTLILVIYFCILMAVNPVLTVFIFVFSFLVIILPAQLGRHASKYMDLQTKKLGNISSFLEESFSNVETIKSLNKYDYTQKKFQSVIFDYLKTNIRLNIVWAGSYAVNTFMYSMSRIFIIFLGAYFVLTGSLSFSNYIFFIFSYGSLYEIIQNLYSFFVSQMPHGASNLTRLDELFNLRRETDKGVYLDDFNSSIVMKDITFGYTETPVLDGFSFEFHKGKSYCIVGESGSGKSTILSLLTGLYAPRKGEFTIDNNSMTNITPDSYRRLVGYVGQFPFLYHLSVGENIWLGDINTDMGASAKEISAAAKFANIDKDIAALPHGYGTVLSNAIDLSEGQKQRISIARAFYGKNRILLFDEPTRSVEHESKKIIFEAIGKYKKKHNATIVMVTHEFINMEMFDEILLIDKGAIAGKGTHRELLRKNALYRKLNRST